MIELKNLKERSGNIFSKSENPLPKDSSVTVGDEKITYIDIDSHDNHDIIVDQLNGLGFPFSDIKLIESTSTRNKHLEAKFKHLSEDDWWEHITMHRSSYCATSIIAPVFKEIKDVVVVHLMLLYGLSIIVRYLPDLWYEITSGELSIYSSLLEYYLTVFDRVMPKIMLERITEIKMKVSYPGSLTAPL